MQKLNIVLVTICIVVHAIHTVFIQLFRYGLITGASICIVPIRKKLFRLKFINNLALLDELLRGSATFTWYIFYFFDIFKK